MEAAIKDVERQIAAEEKKIGDFESIISPLGKLSGKVTDIMWRKEREFLGARKRLLAELKEEFAAKRSEES